jgi:hypothetical protein
MEMSIRTMRERILPTALAQHPATADSWSILTFVAIAAGLVAIAGGGYWWASRARRHPSGAENPPLDAAGQKQRSAVWPLGLKIGGALGAVLALAGEWSLDDQWNVVKLLVATVVGCVHGQWIGVATAFAIRAWPRKRWDLIGLVLGGIGGAAFAATTDRGPSGDLGPYLLVSVIVGALLGGALGMIVALIRWFRRPRHQ